MDEKTLLKAKELGIEVLTTLGKFGVGIVDVDKIELAEKNARFMGQQTYKQLVENIEDDGQLSSVPFLYVDSDRDKLIALSGNHRVKAAISANIERIIVMFNITEMTHDEQVALQLSHNSISGQDDMTILRELYHSIEEPKFREYAHIDERDFEALDGIASTLLLESVDIPESIVVMAFLGQEKESAMKTLKEAISYVDDHKDEIIVSMKDDYIAFMEMIEYVRSTYDVLNATVVFRLLIQALKNHMDGDKVEDLFDGETVLDGYVVARIGSQSYSIPEAKAKDVRQYLLELSSEV